MLRLAVFDVDGTLVDSRATILQAAVEAAETLGLTPPDYEAVRQIVGLSLHEAIRQMEPGLTDAELADYVAEFQKAFSRMHQVPGFKEPLYAGAMEMVHRLKAEGWLLGIATGNSRRGVQRLLDNHDWHRVFDTAWCADDGPGKPHPHMLEGAMRSVGVDPDVTVMIGDTSHDMKMAVAAKTRAQGVSWGFHTPDEVLSGGAHHLAGDFDTLMTALDDWAAGLRLR
ncbi:MAG: HAD-IA family hydrolase [Asticcacaulis sp.]